MDSTYTLKKIADELNVTRTTVYNVINKKGSISKEMTDKVLKKLDEVGYKPNKLGMSLAKRLKKKIAVIFHDDSEFYKDLKIGVLQAADEIRDYGFEVDLVVVDKNHDMQIDTVKKALAENVDGIAISPYLPEKMVDIIDETAKRGIPLITYNNDSIGSTRQCYVGINYYKSGRIAGEVLGKLVKNGKVALLNFDNSYWQNMQRLMGVREILDTFGNIQIIGLYKEFGDYESSYTNMKLLLNQIPDLKGILVLDGGNGILPGMYKAIEEYGGPQIDIVCFDLYNDTKEGIAKGYVSAAVYQDPFSQGYYAVKILFNWLLNDRPPKFSVYPIKHEVVYKENLECFSTSNRIELVNNI